MRLPVEYAATIWNHCKKGYVVEIGKVQLKATKLLYGISHLRYADNLAALNLPTLVHHDMRGI